LDGSEALKTAIPRYVEVKDNPGMIFGDEDLLDFERYVGSMDVTELANRNG
jgi:hypothetical protein